MRKKNVSIIQETIFDRMPEVLVGSRIVSKGDLIKIIGEHGGKFKFHSLVTNTVTGAEWIDCFEVYKGIAGAWRSFRSDRIKLIPIKRSRKNVN